MSIQIYKKFLAIVVALTILCIMFLTDLTYAKSTVKSKIKINGVEYINDEVTSEGSTNSDIDVKIENDKGSIKYKVNGEEKIIQLTPDQNISVNETVNENINITEDSNVTVSEDLKDENSTSESKKLTVDKRNPNIIERVMQAMDEFFAKVADLFNG